MSLIPHARKIAIVAAGGLAAGLAVALPAAASSSIPVHYTFTTHDNSNDLTFNQLLGINTHGVIAGYFGSGAKGHKNKGYLLLPPYHQSNYRVENFPLSAQTQVTGLNDTGVTVGFFSRTNKADPAKNANFGFYRLSGHYHEVVFPAGKAPDGKASPNVDQLLGVNNLGEAVGFYADPAGNFHGYLYSIFTHKFVAVQLPGAVSLTATGINNHGNVAGFFNKATGAVKSFLITHNGHVRILAVPGADATQAFGLNDNREVVGVYTIGTNNYGFTWTRAAGFQTVSDPKALPGTTFVNGVNNAGDLVGFYTSSNTNTNGFLATP